VRLPCPWRFAGRFSSSADQVDLPAGKEPIREDTIGSQFFVLLDGEAEVRRRGRKLNTLHKGDFFGEISLLTERRTTATVKATTAVRAAVITRAAFGKLVRDDPKVQWRLVQALVKRVRADDIFASEQP
jgi:CRP-like cAMP-binding protein